MTEIERRVPNGLPARDLPDPLTAAQKVLALIAMYDQTAPAATKELLASWSMMIERSRLEWEWLEAGVIAVYSAGDAPRNKLGAVISAGRVERRRAHDDAENARRKAEARRLEADHQRGPSEKAYQVDDAIGFSCPDCGAQPGGYCDSSAGRGTKIIPHVGRLSVAYEANRGG